MTVAVNALDGLIALLTADDGYVLSGGRDKNLAGLAKPGTYPIGAIVVNDDASLSLEVTHNGKLHQLTTDRIIDIEYLYGNARITIHAMRTFQMENANGADGNVVNVDRCVPALIFTSPKLDAKWKAAEQAERDVRSARAREIQAAYVAEQQAVVNSAAHDLTEQLRGKVVKRVSISSSGTLTVSFTDGTRLDHGPENNPDYTRPKFAVRTNALPTVIY